ncbi:mitochondrial 37S ribosomal protein bS18m [Thermothelomyces heterothallicus CBS 202.75]|uniref:mitochondrial 37S ribosomal protein bS18m n=1 Tax=Thermothelomyces heterothallicus CBS 202.75 TaxID=1149848 RepID=UPI0037422246
MSSCRQWLSSAVRQCRIGPAQQQPRSFSTSAPVAAFRSIFGDNESNAGTTSGSARRQRSSSNSNEALYGLLTESMERGGPLSAEEQRQVMEQQGLGARAYVKDLRATATTDNYLRQMPRRWRTGDVYAPRDMSPAEMRKWRQGRRPTRDIIDMLGFNPLDNYKNFSLISEFMTTMGRIKHSSETGLRPVNQRKIAKAIRRAIGMGLHPSVHRHPEILRLSRHGLPTASIPTPSDPSQNRL